MVSWKVSKGYFLSFLPRIKVRDKLQQEPSSKIRGIRVKPGMKNKANEFLCNTTSNQITTFECPLFP